ncbi:MAG TPA: hypothetical protein VGG83_30770 [Trebonia sp.]
MREYLGPARRAGQGTAPVQALSLEDALASTRFGAPRVIFAPGIPDLMRDIESLVSGYFSWARADSGAPHRRFGLIHSERGAVQRSPEIGRQRAFPGSRQSGNDDQHSRSFP